MLQHITEKALSVLVRSTSMFARAAIVCTCFLLLAVEARAQTAGSIAGVVKDASGAVVPGVTVEVASEALIERVRTTVTDSEGNYRLVDLPSGTYTVTFSLQGFTTLRREGINVTNGFAAAVN